jgi:hypothetical protein
MCRSWGSMGCDASSGLTGSGASVPSRQVRRRRGAAAPRRRVLVFGLLLLFTSAARWSSASGQQGLVRGRQAALAFASPELPVPEVVEVGEAFDGAYAISVHCFGINLEDVRPDQSDAAGPMLASLLAALFRVPKRSDLPVGWHWRPSRGDLTWRGWPFGAARRRPAPGGSRLEGSPCRSQRYRSRLPGR